jgi:RNA polymerase sigma-B factor
MKIGCDMIEKPNGTTKAYWMETTLSHSTIARASVDAREEPRALLRVYRRTGDPAARERLVELYLPLVRALARRFAHCGEALDDLVQVGSIGLIKAIDRFDPERGSELAGFAVPTITGEIKNHLRDRSTPVRVPRRVTDLRRSLRGPRARLTAGLARPPTHFELAQEAGIDESRVTEAIELERAGRVVSLSEPDERGDVQGVVTVEDAFGVCNDRLLLAAGFRTLAERERRILHLRFFAGLSQAEIAREVGLSQIQVSRLIRSSLERMRAAIDERPTEPARPRSALVQLELGL